MKYVNVYYFNTIQKIGGIETFFFQLAKKYKDTDITIVIKDGDLKQIERLKKYVRVVFYKGQQIKCKKAFFNFNLDIIDNVEADEYCLIVHGDYKMLSGKPPQHSKITKYYGVSQTACDSFTELTGKPCELVYNPLDIEQPKRLLKLCSACRLDDPVKGGKRTEELVRVLDKYCEENEFNYIWTIFTNNVNHIKSKNIVYMEPRLDIASYLKDADYVISLSDDFEGFNYTNNEALIFGTPLVITPCKVYKELGIDETMSIELDFDLKNIDKVVKEMFEKADKFKFDYKPHKDRWNELFIKSKSNYEEEKKMKYLVECNENWKKYNLTYRDTNKIPEKGEQFIIDNERKETLLGQNIYKKEFITVIEEIKEEDIEVEEVKKTKKTTKKK